MKYGRQAEVVFICFTFDARRAFHAIIPCIVRFFWIFFVSYNRWQSFASVLRSFSKNGRFFTPLLLFQGAPASYPVR
jgi:hypothetical protein